MPISEVTTLMESIGVSYTLIGGHAVSVRGSSGRDGEVEADPVIEMSAVLHRGASAGRGVCV